MSETLALLPGLSQVAFPTAGPEALIGGAGFVVSSRPHAPTSIPPSTLSAANVVTNISATSGLSSSSDAS
jgi:hypothetical protein